MDPVAPFLDDIVAHPHDDAPRLILADWIEENADRLPPERAAELRARGEFIRVQYALEGMHPGNPRRPGLEALQAALLQPHKAAWSQPVAFLRDNSPRFRRGFIEHVTAFAETLGRDGGERIRRAVPLRALAVIDERADFLASRDEARQGARTAILARAAQAAALEQVEELDLARVDWPKPESAEAWMRSPRLGRLRKLVLSTDPWAFRALAASRLRLQLRSLELREGTVWAPQPRQEEWRGLAREARALAFPALEALQLPGPLLGRPGASEVFAGLEMPALARVVLSPGTGPAGEIPAKLILKAREVDLSGTPAQSALDRLDRLPPLPALETLSLSRCALDADHADRLARLADRFPSLWSLDLSTNRLGDQGATVLARSHLLAETRALNLSYNGIRAAGLRRLAEALPAGLASLCLSWNTLAGGVLHALARSEASATLQALDAGYGSIADDDALALASLPAGKLHSLSLGTNRLSDAAVRVLASSPALSGLEALDLSNNRLTDAAADALLDSPLVRQLRLLLVFGNDLSAGAMARLRAGFRGILG